MFVYFFQPNLRPSPDYQRKRYRNDERSAAEGSRRADSDQAVLAMLLLVFIIQCPTPLVCIVDLRLLIKHSAFLLQEKNPRFREKGDSDEEEDDYDKRRRRWTCGTIVACMQLFWCPVTAEELTKCSSICFTLLCTTDYDLSLLSRSSDSCPSSVNQHLHGMILIQVRDSVLTA